MTGGQQTFHRHIAQPARRHVGDPQQAHVVIWIHERFQIRQKVAHLAPVEKTLCADQMIAHARLTQRCFQRARLCVGPKQDRLVRPRNTPSQPREINLLDNGPRFLLVVCETLQNDLCAVAFLRPKFFASAPDVVFDEGVGSFENCVGGPVILFELDDFDVGEMFLHVEQVRDVRPAPAVYALVVISHNAKIAMFLCNGLDQPELGRVRVLVFVHQNIAILVPADLQRRWMLGKQPQGEQD